jgi:hypothetical protein
MPTGVLRSITPTAVSTPPASRGRQRARTARARRIRPITVSSALTRSNLRILLVPSVLRERGEPFHRPGRRACSTQLGSADALAVSSQPPLGSDLRVVNGTLRRFPKVLRRRPVARSPGDASCHLVRESSLRISVGPLFRALHSFTNLAEHYSTCGATSTRATRIVTPTAPAALPSLPSLPRSLIRPNQASRAGRGSSGGG